MAKNKRRFVPKAIAGLGWRIWDIKRYWGQVYRDMPEDLLDELNGQKRSEELTQLQKHIARSQRPAR